MATNEFNVANTSLQKIQPDILGFGITTFEDQLQFAENDVIRRCLLYTSPSPRDNGRSRMPSSA